MSQQVVRCLLKNSEKKILLVRHKNKEYWTLPWGHIEKGESIYKALKREIKEELNINVKILGEKKELQMENIKTLPQPLITYKIKYKNKKWKEEKRLEYIFLASIKKDQIIKTQIEEIDEYKFFSPKEIQEINTFEQVKKLVKMLNF